MNRAFAQAFNSGSMDALLALYEPDAQLINESGQLAVGREQIGAALQGLLSLSGTMQSENVYCHQSGDIALLRARFEFKGHVPDGQPLEIVGHTAEVVRRQADGTWLYLIDHAGGANPMP